MSRRATEDRVDGMVEIYEPGAVMAFLPGKHAMA
jgi:hypothetical protein